MGVTMNDVLIFLKEGEQGIVKPVMCAMLERFGAKTLGLAQILAEGGEVVTPRLTSLATVKPESVQWLWKDRIPYGKLTLIDGDPGLGKTTLALDVAARLTRGWTMPDDAHRVEPADVILMSAEDGLADTLRPRLEAAGADLERVTFLEINDGTGAPRNPVLPDDLLLIEDAITQRKAKLLIIDPLMAYLSGKVNAHNDQDVRRALAALVAMGERTGCAIVVLRHLNKMSGGAAMYRGGGSIGIVGAARSAMLVAIHSGNPEKRVLCRVKCNLSRYAESLVYSMEDYEGVGRIKWEGTCNLTADSLLASQELERAPQRADAEELLQRMLADGPKLTKDVEEAAEKAGISKRTVVRARTRLKVKSRKVNGVYQLELPAESSSANDGIPPKDGIPGIPGIPEAGEQELRYATSATSANKTEASAPGIPGISEDDDDWEEVGTV